METPRKLIHSVTLAAAGCFFLLLGGIAAAVPASEPAARTELSNTELEVSAQPSDGSYHVSGRSGEGQLWARVAALVDHHWLRSSDYPRHEVTSAAFTDGSGAGRQLTIRNTGLSGQPDLLCTLRLHAQPAYVDAVVRVANTTGSPITVQTIRPVEAVGKLIELGGQEVADRVLSDSFSEDRPSLVIHDLASAPNGTHRGVGSQLIYNRDSKHRSARCVELTLGSR